MPQKEPYRRVMHASKVQRNGMVHGQQLLLPLACRTVATRGCRGAAARRSVRAHSIQGAQHGVTARHELEQVVLTELDLDCPLSL